MAVSTQPRPIYRDNNLHNSATTQVISRRV